MDDPSRVADIHGFSGEDRALFLEYCDAASSQDGVRFEAAARAWFACDSYQRIMLTDHTDVMRRIRGS